MSLTHISEEPGKNICKFSALKVAISSTQVPIRLKLQIKSQLISEVV
jgi:hypothetical protein